MKRSYIPVTAVTALVMALSAMMFSACSTYTVDYGQPLKAKECAGMWYEQSSRRARLDIREEGYINYRIRGDETYWGSIPFDETEEGGAAVFTSGDANRPYTVIRFYPDEDMIRAENNKSSDGVEAGEEVVFRRTKYVPSEEELKAEAVVFGTPDESFCGDWVGYPEDVSGQYDLTLGEPDGDGSYPVKMMVNRMTSDDGVYGIDVTANAAVTDGVMIMSGSYYDGSDRPESERQIKAMLEKYDDGLRMVVLEIGDLGYISPGDWFDLKRVQEQE